MGPLGDAIVGGLVVSGLGGVAVGLRRHVGSWLAAGSRRKCERRQRRRGKRPDHLTYVSGWGPPPGILSATRVFRVVVSVGPSTRQEPCTLDPNKVDDFISGTVPQAFNGGPEWRRVHELIRYEKPSLLLAQEPVWAVVQPDGLVRASVPISVEIDGGACFVALDDVAKVVTPLVAAVRAGSYRELFGMSASERLDWFIGLSSGVTPAGNWFHLGGFRFTDPSPRLGPAISAISTPNGGFARLQLQSLSQATTSADVLRPALVAMLQDGGYVDFEHIVRLLLAP